SSQLYLRCAGDGRLCVRRRGRLDGEMIEHAREQRLGGALRRARLRAEYAVPGKAGEAVDDRPGCDGRRLVCGPIRAIPLLAAHRLVEDEEGAPPRRLIVRIGIVDQRLAPQQVELRRMGEGEAYIGDALPPDARDAVGLRISYCQRI